MTFFHAPAFCKVLALAGLARAVCGCTSDANESDAGLDAGSDQQLGDAGSDRVGDGAVGPPGCPDAVAGGALGAVEVVAANRPNPFAIGISTAGAVWLEQRALGSPIEVYLDSANGPASLGITYSQVVGFEVYQDHFASSDLPSPFPRGFVVHWGSVTGLGQATISDPSRVSIVGFGLDDLQIYIAWGERLPGSGGVLVRHSFSSPPDPPTELYAGDILALALDEAYLYWFSSEPFDQFAIQRMPKGGGAPERLGTSTTLPRRTSTTLPRGLARSLVAHSSALFWAPEANYKVGQSYVIYSLLAGMQRPFVLADDPNGIAGIAADSNYVYWASNYTDAGRGRIMRVRRCGGPPEAVAENQDQPFDVAVDDSAVYWVNLGSQDSGSVMRMAKR